LDTLDKAIGTTEDTSFGMVRDELSIAAGTVASFGHVFNDGPKPIGRRYRMNAVAMTFKTATT
jgi:peptide-methionine (R)-S-oxide reductase